MIQPFSVFPLPLLFEVKTRTTEEDAQRALEAKERSTESSMARPEAPVARPEAFGKISERLFLLKEKFIKMTFWTEKEDL